MPDLSTIPNNVDLESDSRLQRALAQWQPNFLQWWLDVGPQGWQAHDVYLRTAVSVEPSGWARFAYVKMPEYRWGIFLVPESGERRIGFGDYGDDHVRIALIENEHRLRQAVRGIRDMFRKDGLLRGAA